MSAEWREAEILLRVSRIRAAEWDLAPDALSPLRRQTPREEPGALAAHAGVCEGGGAIRFPTGTIHSFPTAMDFPVMRR